MTSPQSKRDIQVFLGMVGYYRQFIVDFSKTAQPLFHLLKNDSPFIWSSNCKIAFDLLRKALISAPVLAYPNFSLPFVIQTDASLYAAGAVLSQVSLDGIERPIAYCSQTLNKHEHNYTVTEHECLAMIFALKQFRAYVYGTKFRLLLTMPH